MCLKFPPLAKIKLNRHDAKTAKDLFKPKGEQEKTRRISSPRFAFQNLALLAVTAT
jgi:hypothetical protein